MKRRLQVFVSSTYEDLRTERQAAVEAILKAGHIPAGMELFTAGSESQLQVIRRWIQDSDVYVLILGGRYGSIEPNSGLSYTEVEFDYARTLGKPLFAIVISNEGIEAKVKAAGLGVLEQKNEEKLRKFREKVTSLLCAFFSTPQEVKLAVFETLPQFSETLAGGGWIPAGEGAPSEDVAKQLTRLLNENEKLRAELEKLQKRVAANEGALNFDELQAILSRETVTIAAKPGVRDKAVEVPLLVASLRASDDLARGVTNRIGTSDYETFLFYQVASRLAAYGLVEHVRVPANVAWQRLKLSKEGIKFLTRIRAQEIKAGDDTTGAGAGLAPIADQPKSTPAPKRRSTRSKPASRLDEEKSTGGKSKPK